MAIVGRREYSRGVHFEIDRADFHHTRVVNGERPSSIPDGHVLLDVESFALTANNISYAVAGDALAYWDFFPVERPWGRIPVMGIGRVVASTTPGVEVGGRYFGFFPMADHHVVEAAANAEGFVDRGQHRAAHAPAYRSFNLVDNDPAYSRELEGHYLIARGLFITSFLVDDFLGDEGFFGAHSVIITSASSRTSLALAHRLRERGGMQVVGLTSASHTSFVAGTGLYDQVVDYDQLETIDATAKVTFNAIDNASTPCNSSSRRAPARMASSEVFAGALTLQRPQMRVPERRRVLQPIPHHPVHPNMRRPDAQVRNPGRREQSQPQRQQITVRHVIGDRPPPRRNQVRQHRHIGRQQQRRKQPPALPRMPVQPQTPGQHGQPFTAQPVTNHMANDSSVDG